MITSPAIRERFEAYLAFDGSVNYMDYVTKPDYQVKEKTYI